mmetsp:Transcript_29900/g.81683  ORF Transcript_29900/g.81683 Transcript_29900/m.81683 type:complete len:82 (+) Transcript_29900:1607-1852(+)
MPSVLVLLFCDPDVLQQVGQYPQPLHARYAAVELCSAVGKTRGDGGCTDGANVGDIELCEALELWRSAPIWPNCIPGGHVC